MTICRMNHQSRKKTQESGVNMVALHSQRTTCSIRQDPASSAVCRLAAFATTRCGSAARTYSEANTADKHDMHDNL